MKISFWSTNYVIQNLSIASLIHNYISYFIFHDPELINAEGIINLGIWVFIMSYVF